MSRCSMFFVFVAGCFAAALALGRPAGQTPPLATPTLDCPTHETAMALSLSDTAPQVGETLTVTVILSNTGCSGVGLPLYYLAIQSEQPWPVLVPNPPNPITHTLAIPSGGADTARFTLHVLGSGPVTLTASASFEVHLGYPGPAYWSRDSAGPLGVTVAATDTEVAVLQQAAYEVGCFPDVTVGDATYSFGCPVAAGHSVEARIQRFETSAEAQAAFETGRGTLALQSFRCYPAYEWLREGGAVPGHQQGLVWLAERWLVVAQRTDDTDIPVAPPPQEVSEAIYRAAFAHRLFRGCDVSYLPFLYRTLGKLVKE